ncbi:hypothetical protein [Butyricicoccus sp.]|uniref:hypothetical protein n=1 Tax=Butyricicoccus sp. TaxID=2049021 RepID=UPI003F15ECB7
MNFSEVKSVMIPEGEVEKIESGGVTLFQKHTELVCNPVLTIQAYKGLVEDRMTVEANLSGISSSLLNAINTNGSLGGIIYIVASRISDPYSLKATTAGRIGVYFTKFTGDTVTGAYIRTSSSGNTATSSSYRYYRAYINYTDLSGNTQYLYSDPIKASYKTAVSIS